MTCQNDCSQFDPAMALLIENGFDGVAGTIEILLNNAMQTHDPVISRRVPVNERIAVIHDKYCQWENGDFP